MKNFIVLVLLVCFFLLIISCEEKPTEIGDETVTVIDFDGNIYGTVQIGDQIWMAENLKVSHYNNGDPIPTNYDGSSWTNLSTGSYCIYDNITSNSNTYGYLYNWFAIDTDNLAPEGWHIPSEEEWLELIGNIEGGSHIVGGKIKSTGTIEEGNGLWYSPNTGATNESGFTAFPSGSRRGSENLYPQGVYRKIGSSCFFWSSNSNNFDGLYFNLDYDNSEITSSYNYKNTGISIRCIKDN